MSKGFGSYVSIIFLGVTVNSVIKARWQFRSTERELTERMRCDDYS